MSDRIPLRNPGFCLRTTPTMVVVFGSSWCCCCTSATNLPPWQCLVSCLSLSVRSKNSRVDCSENIAPRCVSNSGLSSYDSFKVDREHVDCQEDHQAPVVPEGPLRRTAQPIEDNRFLSVSRPLLCLHVSIQACAILHAVHGSWCGPNGHSGDPPSIRTVVSIEEASLLFSVMGVDRHRFMGLVHSFRICQTRESGRRDGCRCVRIQNTTQEASSSARERKCASTS